MQQGLFAVLNDYVGSGQNSLKILRLKPTNDSSSYRIHEHNPIEDDEDFEVTVSKSKDTSPNLERVSLEEGPIYLWRTPYTVSYRGVWIPVIDSDERDRFPGEFLYVYNKTVKRCMKISLAQMQLRVTITTLMMELSDTQASVPRFVLDALKRDAIAREYECPISTSLITADMPVSITECYHIFEKESLHKWRKENTSCPLCNRPITSLHTL